MTFKPDESRDKDGKWTAGGSAPDVLTKPIPAATLSVQELKDRATAVAKAMGFDPNRIEISEEAPTFELNGKNYNTAGVANISDTVNGTVVLYRPVISSSDVEGLVAHEIEHMKFQTALDAKRRERPEIEQEIKDGARGVIATDGSGLLGSYQEKYPATHQLYQLNQTSSEAFAASDGVSPYSLDWWQAWRDGKASTMQAMHETLAEMARVKYETGKFPEHMGHRVLSYMAKSPNYTGKPTPKKAVGEGEKRWRDLYRAVNEINK